MTNFSKLIEVANATVVFQGTNHHPSLANCEEHERYLAALAKDKEEINARRLALVEKAIAFCTERTAAKKPLTLPQMRAAAHAAGIAIGMESWRRLYDALTHAFEFPPKRTKSNWLVLKDWYANARRAAKNLSAGQTEWRKTHVHG